MKGIVWKFPLVNLRPIDSDFWLYQNDQYDNPGSMIHGLKWGGIDNVGKMSIAEQAGLWPSTTTSLPSPPPGYTLAWDGSGFTAHDLYLDSTPTMGFADPTNPASIENTMTGLDPGQDFESASPDEPVDVIQDWNIQDGSGDFTAVFVGDVNGATHPDKAVSGTTWLRINDADTAGSNQVTGPVINGNSAGYHWSFFLNQLVIPQASENLPGIMIQHD
jgi:hypothetical protein